MPSSGPRPSSMPQPRMNWRSFLFGVCVFGVAFALLGGLDFFRSDETRIRRLLAAEAEAFNDCKGFSVLEHFAPDWQDETTGVTRQALKGGLLYVFQNRHDPKTQRFL